MTSPRPDASQELEYPPIRVNHSLAQLDLNTLIMRSNPQLPAHEATSLEDSTYEVLDNPADLSDEDGHTASVASTTPDDLSVTLSETESEGEDDFEDNNTDEADQLAESTATDPLDDQVIVAGEDSTLTERPALGDSDSGFHFKMEERPATNFEGTEGYSIVKEFSPEQSSSKVLEPYGCSEIRLTMRAGLADRFYPDRGSFRVLFMGNMDEWSEEGIKSSLLNALLASPGSSKSVMVHGQMQPYSPVLHADRCVGIVQQHEVRRHRAVFKLEGSNEAELVLGISPAEKKNVDAASLPDLAVFCHPKSGTSTLSAHDMEYARNILACNGIPIIEITDHRRFNESTTKFTPMSFETLHVCVEGRHNPDDEFGHLDRLPVDVYTFMHLEPSDLNRHLAAISPRLNSPQSWNRMDESKSWHPSNLLPPSVQRTGAIWKTLVAVVLLSLWITSTFFNLSPSQLRSGNTTSDVVSPAVSSILVSTPLISPAVITASEASTPTPSAPSVKDKIDEFFSKQRSSVQKEVAKSPEDALKEANRARKEAQDAEQQKMFAKLREKLEKKNAEMRRREEAAKTAKIGVFEIRASGDQQFILRPAKGFIGRTRKPQLQIQVFRDSEIVPIRYERTIDGVYIVDLESEYPAGFFNVSIATHSKPLMQQSFNISLGHNKSLLDQWLVTAQRGSKKLASMIQRDTFAAQQHIHHVTTKFAQQVESATSRLLEGSAQIWKDKVGHPSQDIVERVQETTKKVERGLTEVRDQTWTGIRQATAPVRTSRRTLWARNNAYLLRCGFERTVGLSSKKEDGKKTRSCEAANW